MTIQIVLDGVWGNLKQIPIQNLLLGLRTVYILTGNEHVGDHSCQGVETALLHRSATVGRLEIPHVQIRFLILAWGNVRVLP